MDIFDARRDRPASVSPKLDGVNARANRDGLFFKGGAPIPGRDKLKAALADHFRRNPDAPEVSGELYNHGESFQRIIAKAKSGKGRLGFHVFPGQAGPALRGAGVHQVAETPVKSAAELDRHYKTALKSGYEGQVVRTESGNLVKRKPVRDAEFPVVAAIPGKRGKASLILSHASGKTFRAQTTAAIAAKVKAGQPATVAYHGQNEDGRPRSGVVKAIRDYEGSTKHFSAGEPVRLVARAVCIRGDMILASRDELGRYWLPGGGVEPGECSVVRAAIRELKEETGYVVAAVKDPYDEIHPNHRGRVLWRNETTGGNREDTHFVQIQCTELGKAAPEPGEEKHRYEWFPVSVVLAERDSDPRRERMLNARRGVIMRCVALLKASTAKSMNPSNFSAFAPAGPDGMMVRLRRDAAESPEPTVRQPSERTPGWFVRHRGKIITGAVLAGVLAMKSRAKNLESASRSVRFDQGRNESGHFTYGNSLGSIVNRYQKVGRNINRAGEVVSQSSDIAQGKKVQGTPFYKKAWFRNGAVGGAALAGAAYMASRGKTIPVPGKLRDAAKNRTMTGVLAGSVVQRVDAVNNRLRAGTLSAKTRRLVEFAIARRTVDFDLDSTLKGWDLRDARGKSARVFAPGAQKRNRREKTTWEKTDTQRAVRNGLAVAATAGAVGTGLLFMQNRKLRAAANTAADTARKGLAPIVKDKAGTIAFPGAAGA